MDEIWLRVALVVGLLAVAAGISVFSRKRHASPPRQVVTDLGPGLHLFTSSSCSTCGSARDALIGAVGASGFREHTWEDDPEVFATLEVDAVPAVLKVGSDGSAFLYPGQPDLALISA